MERALAMCAFVVQIGQVAQVGELCVGQGVRHWVYLELLLGGVLHVLLADCVVVLLLLKSPLLGLGSVVGVLARWKVLLRRLEVAAREVWLGGGKELGGL